ncbi:MAG TPA: nucleotide exchange factor GrpE [Candidatus Saccharimonadales bacterium]|nr:nucleotide exchange factor GrpE [Candidatus Saccharimonadales bacterium]
MESEKNNQNCCNHDQHKQSDQNNNHEAEIDQDQVSQEPGLQEQKSQSSQDEISLCTAELSLWKDQCKRISAEFENFKRRTQRDQVRWAEIAKESILLELLSFVDTFEMALKQQNGTDCAGIEMSYQALIKLLQKHGVIAMHDTKTFDPEFHEAVMQVQSDKHQSGDIVEVLSKGFMIKDRVLRPAKVSVAV